MLLFLSTVLKLRCSFISQDCSEQGSDYYPHPWINVKSFAVARAKNLIFIKEGGDVPVYKDSLYVGVFGRGSPGIRARGLSEEHQTNFSSNLISEKYKTAHNTSIKLLSNGLNRVN
jgi:hypothetical protein